jgi:hypothetical protein
MTVMGNTITATSERGLTSGTQQTVQPMTRGSERRQQNQLSATAARGVLNETLTL